MPLFTGQKKNLSKQAVSKGFNAPDRIRTCPFSDFKSLAYYRLGYRGWKKQSLPALGNQWVRPMLCLLLHRGVLPSLHYRDEIPILEVGIDEDTD